MSYAVQSNIIKGLTVEQYKALREMCVCANNLYNVALYNIRQYYFAQEQFLTYESNYHECKTNENYGQLQAGVAQQILKVADRSFKSFFNLIKKCKQGDYQYQSVKLPHYREKGGMFNLIMSLNAISIKNGYFQVPMSRKFKATHNNIKIEVPFPKRLEHKVIKEVRIIPIHNGRSFRVQYVYEVENVTVTVNPDNIMAIDVGVENLATCVSNVETPFIIDGRKLKSLNQHWNKRKAYLQSIADKQGHKHTHLIDAITDKRNRQVNDYIKKSARYIINNCIENKIGTLIIGYSTDFKRYSNLGRHNNQSFTQIPFGALRSQLRFLCSIYGIEYIEQNEDYTSKASYIDNDTIPTSTNETYTFSGRRIHRGLYKSKDGILINADVNGAFNILRKCKQNLSFERLCSGCLAHPQRIRLV